jgi:hypothetical protein
MSLTLVATALIGFQLTKPTLPVDLQFLAPLKPTWSIVKSPPPDFTSQLLRKQLLVALEKEREAQQRRGSDGESMTLRKRIAFLRAQIAQADTRPKLQSRDTVYTLHFTSSTGAVIAMMRDHLARPISANGAFTLRSGSHGTLSNRGAGAQMTVIEPLSRLIG